MTSSTATLTGGATTATITFTFSTAPVDGFDVETVGGVLGSVAPSTTNPLIYTALFTLDTGFAGDPTIGVPAGSYANASGTLGNAGSVELFTAVPTLTLSVPNPIVVNPAEMITGTIDLGDVGSTISVYAGTKLLGTTKAAANGTWQLAATLPAAASDVITATASNAVGLGTSPAVDLQLFTFGNATDRAAAQVIASEIDAAAAGTLFTISAKGTVAIPTTAEFVLVEPGASGSTITSSTSPDLLIGASSITFVETLGSVPATQQKIALSDSSGSDTLAFSDANVALSGDAAGIDIYQDGGTLSVNGPNTLTIVYDATSTSSLTLNGTGSLVFINTTGASSGGVYDDGGANTVVAGAGAETLFGSKAGEPGGVFFDTSGSLTFESQGGSDTIVAGAYAATVFGGAGTDEFFLGTGALTFLAGSGGVSQVIGQQTTTANVDISGTAGSTVELFGPVSGADLLAGVGAETLDSYFATGSSVLFGGSGHDLVLLSQTADDEFIAGSGAATIEASTGTAAQSFAFISGSAGGSDLIGNFSAADFIALNGYHYNSSYVLATQTAVVGGVQITLEDHTVVTIEGISALKANQVVSTGTVQYVPCFCLGTLIRTATGDRPVEALAIGDMLTTLDGSERPIRWIGRRSYAGCFVAGNHLTLPVCFKAGSLSPGVPARDLRVSPGHAMVLDGQLVPAWRLVNGVSIVQADTMDDVTYLHIELDRHAVIFAEGAPVESYLEDCSRGQFHNAAEYAALYPDAPPMRPLAPRMEDGFGLQSLWDRLALRAGLIVSVEPIGKLRGFVDSASSDHVTGWAQDLDSPEEPVALEIWVGGHPVVCVLANAYRADLRRTGIGKGCHAFDAALPAGHAGLVQVRRVADGAVLTKTDLAVATCAA